MSSPDPWLDALRRIYRRPDRPAAWQGGGNLPWDDRAFGERMLREHLDESHGAASRIATERRPQIDWLSEKLGLDAGHRLLDLTCGPGLYAVEWAERGVQVVGIDFAPTSIEYARELARSRGVADSCTFLEADVRDLGTSTGTGTGAPDPGSGFDAALFLYGQLAVFPREQAAGLLAAAAARLRPGGRLAVELLEQEKVDKTDSNWWFTDESRIWGDRPFLHLGERFWDAENRLSTERFHTIELETGALHECHLSDQTYAVAEMEGMLKAAGFRATQTFAGWDGVALYDAAEWNVYIATR